ncbi:tetraspanin-CD63 receptor [Schistosoma japonicum]|uniref:Tetraspanin-CD63 receptor n=1 Tax=Schistosoma japonicum TaxID=6182 RepID=A0A4Z2D416_SCHJA|nr:tetraspanin-CD63 receptor [Schistosoma japonicum]
MPKTKVRYAFKGLNAVTGIICLSVLIMCTTVFWLKVSAYLLRPQLMKLKVPVNLNNVVLRSGLNYIMRNLLSPVTLPVIILGICYTSICAFGFFIAYNRNTTNFLIYEVLFTVCVVSHLVMFVIFLKDPSSMRLHAKTELEKLVKSYKSLSSMDAASLFLGLIMINLKCCGYTDSYDFFESKYVANKDIYDGVEYSNIAIPIACCEMNTEYKMLDTECPNWHSTSNHQFTVGCRDVFADNCIQRIKIFLYASLTVIFLAIIMIACCVLILKELW